MSTITTRSGKGSPLTHNEVDANFTNLNTDKYQSGDNVTLGTATVTTFTSTGIDDNATSTAITIDSSENVGIGTATAAGGNVQIYKNSSTGSDYGLSVRQDGTDPIARFAGNGDVERLRIDSNGKITAVTGTSSSAPIITGTAAQGQEAGIKVHREGSTRAGLSLFTEVSGVESDVIYCDSDGNVGIGVTDPDNLLTVGGGTQPRILIRANGDSGASQFNFGDASDIDVGRLRYDHSDNSMGFFTSATERMRIDSSGNVGIGTASPNEKLNVNGNVRVTSGFVSFSGSISTPSEAAALYRPVDNTLAISTANTERMRIDSSGKVGIGTTSPLRNLQIGNHSGSQQALSIQASTTGKSDIFLGDGTGSGEYAGLVRYDHASDFMAFWTASSESMRIDSSGNVGIGTTSPDESLVVDGGVKIRGTNKLSFTNTSDQTYITAAASNVLAFGTDSTERMRIDSSGNVGIGTTSPNELLHIHENSSDGSWLRITNSTTGAAGSNGLLVGINSAEEANILNYSATALRFSTSGTERMRILSSGGITFNGDTAAANALDDYEEGTFTMYLYDAASGGNASVNGEVAYYTKIGRLVTINVFAFNNINTTGMTSSGAAYFNLPFTSGSTGRHVGQVNHHGFTYAGNTSYQNIFPQVTQSVSRGYFGANGYGVSDASVKVSDIGSGADDIVTMTLTYHV